MSLAQKSFQEWSWIIYIIYILNLCEQLKILWKEIKITFDFIETLIT